MATAPRKSRKKPTDQAEALTPAQEYRAALEEFTSFSTNNETAEAVEARDRLDRAETRRRWWHF